MISPLLLPAPLEGISMPPDISSKSDYDEWILSLGGSLDQSKSHKRKMGVNHVSRSPNQFIIFGQHCRLVCLGKTRQANLSKMIGKTWKLLPASWLVRYKKISDVLAEHHKLQHPNWKYRPITDRPKLRRRVLPYDDEYGESVSEDGKHHVIEMTAAVGPLEILAAWNKSEDGSLKGHVRDTGSLQKFDIPQPSDAPETSMMSHDSVEVSQTNKCIEAALNDWTTLDLTICGDYPDLESTSDPSALSPSEQSDNDTVLATAIHSFHDKPVSLKNENIRNWTDPRYHFEPLIPGTDFSLHGIYPEAEQNLFETSS